MATLHGKRLSGLLGNLVIRNYKKWVTVSGAIVPGTMKQTEATKLSANTFGLASMLARKIRSHSHVMLNKLYDSTLVNRLNTALLRILLESRNKKTQLFDFKPNAFSTLAGLEFNALSPVSESLNGIPTVGYTDGKLFVRLSASGTLAGLKFPHDTFCRLSVTALHIQLDGGKVETYPQLQSIEVSAKTSGLPVESMVFEALKGCLCIITVTLSYIRKVPTGLFTVNTKEFSPACIADALIIDGEFEESKRSFTNSNLHIISQKDQLQ